MDAAAPLHAAETEEAVARVEALGSEISAFSGLVAHAAAWLMRAASGRDRCFSEEARARFGREAVQSFSDIVAAGRCNLAAEESEGFVAIVLSALHHGPHKRPSSAAGTLARPLSSCVSTQADFRRVDSRPSTGPQATAGVDAAALLHAAQSEEAAARVEALSSEVVAFSALLTDIAKSLTGTLSEIYLERVRLKACAHKSGESAGGSSPPRRDAYAQVALRSELVTRATQTTSHTASAGAQTGLHVPATDRFVTRVCLRDDSLFNVRKRVWFDSGGHLRPFPQLAVASYGYGRRRAPHSHRCGLHRAP